MGWTLHMIMCVLLCYPVSIHISQLLSTGRPISSFINQIKIREILSILYGVAKWVTIQRLITYFTSVFMATNPAQNIIFENTLDLSYYVML